MVYSLKVIMSFLLLVYCASKAIRGRMSFVTAAKRSADNIGEREVENGLWSEGYKYVIGVDEAGRGPLAGPVVAAAVCAPKSITLPKVGDSKKLTEKIRNEIYHQVINDPGYLITLSVVDHKTIDEINILQATMQAMKTCIDNMIEEKFLKEDISNTYALIDGNKAPNKLEIKSRPVIRGDALIYPIAIASVIAKVERDKIMTEYDVLYPMYGFAQHKGYPTKSHIQAIHKYGPSPIHRLSFKPLKGR